MLKLKEIKPMFSKVLVTEDLYGWDDRDEFGVITATKGDIKPYQTVIAVGDDVKYVKPGDVVAINLYRYAELKEDPNSVKAINGNSVVKLRLNEVTLTDKDGEPATCFIIDVRDIEYILADYEEVTYDKKNNLKIIERPKVNLILPPDKRVIV